MLTSDSLVRHYPKRLLRAPGFTSARIQATTISLQLPASILLFKIKVINRKAWKWPRDESAQRPMNNFKKHGAAKAVTVGTTAHSIGS